MNKILLIDKPSGWTSFDVVAKIRGAYRSKLGVKVKVGHAGTLDPFATGLLIVLVGDATKDQERYMKLDKEYLATLQLGATSNTGDPEGIITKTKSTGINIKETDIKKILNKFVGAINQTPPIFSAVKIDGKRAYQLARAGKEVTLKPRNVIINKLQIINYSYPELRILVNCSSGTYIRSLAQDIGDNLGTGAYLTELRRTKINNYKIENSQTVESVIKKL